jgi:hypothetical protein
MLDDIRNKILASLIGRPDQWPASRVSETQPVADLFPVLELLRSHKLCHLQMPLNSSMFLKDANSKMAEAFLLEMNTPLNCPN